MLRLPPLLIVTVLVAVSLLPLPSSAQQPAAPPPTETAELEALLHDLRDSTARQRLIGELELLLEARRRGEPASAAEPAAEPTAESTAESTAEPAAGEAQNGTALLADTEVQEATGELLLVLSQRLANLRDTVLVIASDLGELTALGDWLGAQIRDPRQRALWLSVLVNLALVLGAGYLGFTLLWLALRRPYRALAERPDAGWLGRALLLVVMLLLELVPILAFAGASYAALAILDLQRLTRLVALAWVHASLILRLVMALGRVLFAPHAPRQRLLVMDDATARTLQRWLRWIAATAVYGYFALEAALLLGLPYFARDALLRVVGLIVTGQLVALILRQRRPVAKLIRGERQAGSRLALRVLRRRLAQVWFLLAIAYVLGLYGIWNLGVTGGFTYMLRATVLTLLVLAVSYSLLAVLTRLVNRLRLSRTIDRERFPGLERRLHRYLPTLHRLLRGLIYLLSLGLILEIWGVAVLDWLWSPPGWVLVSTVLEVAAIVLGALVLWEVASSLIESFLTEHQRGGKRRMPSARTRTLLTVARNALLVFITIVAGLAILAELGVNIGPLVAGAGVLGVALGFGSQKLVQDIITGVFILFEDLISVGDVVDVGGKAGLVEAVSLRNVRLRDLAGTVHTIPYSTISTISNLTKGFSFYVFDIGVAYREDVDRVMGVLKELGEELRQDPGIGPKILEPLEIFGVDAFADSAVVIKCRFKTQPIQQWTVGREFNRRIKNRFDELGIEIPYPHTTVYFGEDRQGHAPPARLWFERGDAPGPLAGQPLAPHSATPTPEGEPD